MGAVPVPVSDLMPDTADSTPRERLFWRHHPALPGSASEASSCPAIHAIFVEGLKPLVGGHLPDLLPGSLKERLRSTDYLLHESFHLLQGFTSVGELLRNLAYSKYFLLHRLGEGLTLRLPEWSVQGCDRVSSLSVRADRLARQLDGEAGVVDEALCTLLTLGLWKMFSLMGHLSPAGFERLRTFVLGGPRAGSGSSPTPTRAADHLYVRQVCRDVLAAAWFGGLALPQLGSFLAFLFATGSVALNVERDVLRQWWAAGRISARGSPRARLDEILKSLLATDNSHLDEVVRIAAQKSELVKAMTSGTSFEELIEDSGTAYEAPDPYREMVEALGLNVEEARSSDPLGRALDYLITGARGRSHEAAWATLEARSRLGGTAAWSMVVPLVTRDKGRQRCLFEARFPVGRVMNDVAWGRLGVGTLWERMVAGEPLGRDWGRMTVLPAAEETRLVWHTHAVTEDLLVPPFRLHCACEGACQGGWGCCEGRLLPRVGRHTVRSNGRPLPPAACSAKC